VVALISRRALRPYGDQAAMDVASPLSNPLNRPGRTPNCTATLRMPISPFWRAARIPASVSGPIRGRPIGLPLRVPLAAALDMPASTRSRIIERSNSANTPIIWNMALPDGVGRVETLLVQVEIDVLCMELSQQLEQAR
jgi:hypothetical protein